MTIDSKIENGLGILVPHGSIDSTTADLLDSAASALVPECVEGLSLDFSDVDYISSKCLRILISLKRKLEGKPVSVINVNSTVKDVFTLSGLSQLFDVR